MSRNSRTVLAEGSSPISRQRMAETAGVFVRSVLRPEERDWTVANRWLVQLTLATPALGTVPTRNIRDAHIAQKLRELAKKGKLAGVDDAMAEELLQSEQIVAEDVRENGVTGFFSMDGHPLLLDYQIRGFMKEAARAIYKAGEGGNIKYAKATVDAGLWIHPVDYDQHEGNDPATVALRRAVFFRDPEGNLLDFTNTPEEELLLERPIRMDTPRGPRVAIATSCVVPAGSTLEFWVDAVGGFGITDTFLRKLLAWGEVQGICQWRSGGWGRFVTTKLDVLKARKAKKTAEGDVAPVEE